MRRVKGVPTNPKRHQMRPVLIGPCCTLVSMKGHRFQLFSTLHTHYTRSGTRSRVAPRAHALRSHHRSLCAVPPHGWSLRVCVWVIPLPFSDFPRLSSLSSAVPSSRAQALGSARLSIDRFVVPTSANSSKFAMPEHARAWRSFFISLGAGTLNMAYPAATPRRWHARGPSQH